LLAAAYAELLHNMPAQETGPACYNDLLSVPEAHEELPFS
jgi:hypothetical protein